MLDTAKGRPFHQVIFQLQLGGGGGIIRPLVQPLFPMNRRRPGKINPVFVAFLIPLMVIITAGVFMVMRNHLRHSLPAFNAEVYRNSPNELQGNHYNLDAQIESQLRVDEGFGRMLVVKMLDGAGGHLSVLLPDGVAGDFNSGQRFHLQVVIKDKGLIQVEDMAKY